MLNIESIKHIFQGTELGARGGGGGHAPHGEFIARFHAVNFLFRKHNFSTDSLQLYFEKESLNEFVETKTNMLVHAYLQMLHYLSIGFSPNL